MGKKARKSAQEKQRILEEAKTLGLIETARKHELSYQTLKTWLDIYNVSGIEGLKPGASKISPELKKLLVENQRLKALVADKELELMIKNELLKKTSSLKQTGK
jgi:putative transposase